MDFPPPAPHPVKATLQPYKRITLLPTAPHRALRLLRSRPAPTHRERSVSPPPEGLIAQPPAVLRRSLLPAPKPCVTHRESGRHRPVPPPPRLQPFSRGAADHRARNPHGSKTDEGAAQSPSVPAGQRGGRSPEPGGGQQGETPPAPNAAPVGTRRESHFLKNHIYIYISYKKHVQGVPAAPKPPASPRAPRS